MIKKLFSIVLIFSTIFIFSSCSNNKLTNVEKNTLDNNSKKSDKISVVVSFNPLREFAEAIGKDKISVKTMIPEGVEPHDFEPKPKDMESLNDAKLFIYNGLGMETWVDKTLEAINNKSLEIVEASKGCNLIKEDNGKYDPHIWLSLKEAKNSAKNIKDALIKIDKENKDFYEKNYNEFALQLDNLYEEYNKKLQSVSNKNFVTGHAAFAYLCRDFNLNQNSVEDVFAEGEPTPKKMMDLVDFSKKNNIKVIFMEELASPKVSETLAKEVGASVEKIYTIESKEDNKNYIESMKYNLEKIYNSLK
ncbi:metal ABC transporter substrate-binding protein [Clostridium prolinivorans]|uniref:metal ABC transporter substrate-binding protein n=1 Tax=Clostridium prolinivorans TaxID=2769420 RepID=UPI000FD89FDE|nr:metal ABC transporter substrate-binding protein [Clostridium prolinivorans]